MTPVVASEWIKLRTLRSNAVALGLTIVGTIGVSVLLGATVAAHWHELNPQEARDYDVTNLSLSGWYLTQVVVGVVGALAITSEHATGMIRATFGAVPRRRRVFVAKATVVAAGVLAVAAVCSVGAFYAGQFMLRNTHHGATLAEPGVARAVFGAALYATVIALLGLGLGFIIRNTAGAISALFGVLFVPPILAEAFPPSWHSAIQKYAPLNAGSQIMNVHDQARALGPWPGLCVLALYAAVVMGTAVLLVGVRDA
jgi:ABC-2 type transport system permease protein